MEPLNQEERSKAMVKFIAFYVITTLLVLVAFFFNELFVDQTRNVQKDKLKELTATVNQLTEMDAVLDSVRLHIGKMKEGKALEMEDRYAKQWLDSLSTFKAGNGLTAAFAKKIEADYFELKSITKYKADLEKNGVTLEKSENEKRQLQSDLEKVKADLMTCQADKSALQTLISNSK